MAATLAELFALYDTDKNTAHSYADFYDVLLAPLRETALRVLEVGVATGGSLQAWRDFFPRALVVGVDNGSDYGIWEPGDPRIVTCLCDSCRPGELQRVAQAHEPFDVIVDDGCHDPLVQVATFAQLYPRVRQGGVYVIEDLESIEAAWRLQRRFGGEVHDRRAVKGRFDDILISWHKGVEP